MIATQHAARKAAEYTKELDTLNDSLRATCQDLLDHCQQMRDWAGAAIVAELTDMAGSVLLGLRRAAETHVRQG